MNLLQLSVWDATVDAGRATSLEELAAVTKRYSRAWGFKHHGFAVNLPSYRGETASNYHYFHNIPEPWGHHRYEETYRSKHVDRDPLIKHVRSGYPATAFNSRGTVTHTRAEIIRHSSTALTLHRAGDYGLNAGIVAPVSGPGVNWGFLVMTTDDTSDVREVLPILPNVYFFAHFVMSTARLILETTRPMPNLSPREREMLRWAAIGKPSNEIGRITNLSEKTVDFHLQSAARKLGVSGRCAAVAKAVASGLITI